MTLRYDDYCRRHELSKPPLAPSGPHVNKHALALRFQRGSRPSRLRACTGSTGCLWRALRPADDVNISPGPCASATNGHCLAHTASSHLCSTGDPACMSSPDSSLMSARIASDMRQTVGRRGLAPVGWCAHKPCMSSCRGRVGTSGMRPLTAPTMRTASVHRRNAPHSPPHSGLCPPLRRVYLCPSRPNLCPGFWKSSSVLPSCSRLHHAYLPPEICSHLPLQRSGIPPSHHLQ